MSDGNQQSRYGTDSVDRENKRGRHRLCPDCEEHTEFVLWWRTDLDPETTVVCCSGCGNTVGSFTPIDPRVTVRCPRCESTNTRPWMADYDWACEECRVYFDVRDMDELGTVQPAED